MVNYTEHAKKLTEIANLIERFNFRIIDIERSFEMTNWIFFTIKERKEPIRSVKSRIENIRYIIERLEKYYTKKAKEI